MEFKNGDFTFTYKTWIPKVHDQLNRLKEDDPQAYTAAINKMGGAEGLMMHGTKPLRISDGTVMAYSYVSEFDHLSDEEYTVLVNFGDNHRDLIDTIGYTMAQYDRLMCEDEPRMFEGELLTGHIRQVAVASTVDELRERVCVRVDQNSMIAACLYVVWAMALRLSKKLRIGDGKGSAVDNILFAQRVNPIRWEPEPEDDVILPEPIDNLAQQLAIAESLPEPEMRALVREVRTELAALGQSEDHDITRDQPTATDKSDDRIMQEDETEAVSNLAEWAASKPKKQKRKSKRKPHIVQSDLELLD